MAGKELKGREKVVSKMTRDGLTEENLADGSVKDISHKSRGRPPEMKQDFVFDREKKKDKLKTRNVNLAARFLKNWDGLVWCLLKRISRVFRSGTQWGRVMI